MNKYETREYERIKLLTEFAKLGFRISKYNIETVKNSPKLAIKYFGSYRIYPRTMEDKFSTDLYDVALDDVGNSYLRDCKSCANCRHCIICYSCYQCSYCLKVNYGILCYGLADKSDGFWMLNKEVTEEIWYEAKDLLYGDEEWTHKQI